MKRKYLKDLIEWDKNIDRKPLLVVGARQVGKSYLIEELFAKEYYKDNYLRIDCSDDKDFVKYVYDNDSLNDVLTYIQLCYNFVPNNENLLIIDEAQECLPIIKMMKHFCEKRRDIRLIVTGSLVRTKINRSFKNEKYIFPVGKINELKIYPLTFDEFILNYNENIYNYLINSFNNKENINLDLHKELMNVFNDYLFVGGMPEAVNTFLRYQDDKINAYNKTIDVLKDIYSNYLSDMDLYQASKESTIKSRRIYESIYSQLNKENKNYKCSQVIENTKNRDLINPIEWLKTSNIVFMSNLLNEKITVPLIESNESNYRLYLSDMGLFTFQSDLNVKDFILNKDNAFSGIYYENYVATELVARNKKLCYWKGKRNSELEFIINIGSRIIPIDSKKSRGNLNSMNEYRMHNKKDIIVKVSANQYGYDKENKILTLPFYYFSFFLNDIEKYIEIYN